MSKFDLKEKAIGLRRKGFSYSEILVEIPVAKSTLSLWLRSVGLSVPEKQKITQKRIDGRLRALDTIRANKIKRISGIKDIARKEIFDLIHDPLWLTGLVLYWGEGSKERASGCSVQIINMDLSVHKIFIAWVKKYLQVTSDQFTYAIYIHEKADIKAARIYWSRSLNIDDSKLTIYYKKHNPNPKRSHIGKDYYGILKISILRSIALNRKIAGWIEGVVLYLSSQVSS